MKSSQWAKALFLLCFGLLFACEQVFDYFSSTTFVDVAKERSKLINGIESYQSIEEAKKQFPVWEEIEQSTLGPRDKRPRFDIYKVSIKNYSHLGISGELHVQFFNDRLMETWFYPSAFDKYLDLLIKKEGLVFRDGQDGSRETTLPRLGRHPSPPRIFPLD